MLSSYFTQNTKKKTEKAKKGTKRTYYTGKRQPKPKKRTNTILKNHRAPNIKHKKKSEK